jgi:hypothetical protein
LQSLTLLPLVPLLVVGVWLLRQVHPVTYQHWQLQCTLLQLPAEALLLVLSLLMVLQL